MALKLNLVLLFSQLAKIGKYLLYILHSLVGYHIKVIYENGINENNPVSFQKCVLKFH